jgi:hypothetical protein
MNLQQRIDLLTRLGQYILSDDHQWQEAKSRAHWENGWFIPEFIDRASNNIARQFLSKELLMRWVQEYNIPEMNPSPRKVGIVMAGNIPMVGFHDLLCVFISGHRALVKLSSKDRTLISHLVEKMKEWEPETASLVQFGDMLKDCDAYIATGSNNSAGYFEYYFKKYPHIIRRNRTSVAVITGHESKEDLSLLADDVHLYFGLGCRNVTKIFVPAGYDFIPLLRAFDKYGWMADNNKYKNNYDYNLAILILSKKFYMSNNSLLLSEDPSPFSPVSQLNYEFYEDRALLLKSLRTNSSLQCVVGQDSIAFGQSQCPEIMDYADGEDTLKFLLSL